MKQGTTALEKWTSDNNMQINTCKTHYQIFTMQHGTEEIKIKINNKFIKNKQKQHI